MPPRIGPRRPRRIFLAEWREDRGLTQEQIAGRLDTTHVTISRWETGKNKINTDVQLALAEALDIEPEDLWHPPDRPTADMILRQANKADQDYVWQTLDRIRRAN